MTDAVLAEELLAAPKGGAVGVFASTALTDANSQTIANQELIRARGLRADNDFEALYVEREWAAAQEATGLALAPSGNAPASAMRGSYSSASENCPAALSRSPRARDAAPAAWCRMASPSRTRRWG